MTPLKPLQSFGNSSVARHTNQTRRTYFAVAKCQLSICALRLAKIEKLVLVMLPLVHFTHRLFPPHVPLFNR